MKKFITILALSTLLITLFTAQALSQKSLITFSKTTGLTEVSPTSLVENSFKSVNIEYDTVLPSIIKRKGYPEMGMIFVSTISIDPVLLD